MTLLLSTLFITSLSALACQADLLSMEQDRQMQLAC